MMKMETESYKEVIMTSFRIINKNYKGVLILNHFLDEEVRLSWEEFDNDWEECGRYKCKPKDSAYTDEMKEKTKFITDKCSMFLPLLMMKKDKVPIHQYALVSQIGEEYCEKFNTNLMEFIQMMKVYQNIVERDLASMGITKVNEEQKDEETKNSEPPKSIPKVKDTYCPFENLIES